MQVFNFASIIKLISGSFNTNHIIAYAASPICATPITDKPFTVCSLNQHVVNYFPAIITALNIVRDRCIKVSQAPVKKARFFSTSL